MARLNNNIGFTSNVISAIWEQFPSSNLRYNTVGLIAENSCVLFKGEILASLLASVSKKVTLTGFGKSY